MTLQVGIDEAGRGCWAGPLVAAAVIINTPIAGLNDSKLLTKARRELLEQQILVEAHAYGIGWVGPEEIDRLGLTAATTKAMGEALAQLEADYDEVIIDGNLNYLPDVMNVRTLIKADSLISAVSAASVLAKVARDRYMQEAAITYPQYQFEKHVGYGTQLHIQMLQQHGVSPIHRLSYKPIKKFLAVNP